MYELTPEQRAMADAALTNKLNVIHHVYVDITGDLIAGALLGQVLYWFGADRNGRPRARIQKDGYLWIAKGRADWYEEIRISAKQYDRAAKILKEKGFIEIRTMKFNGNPTSHLRIIPEALNQAIDEWRWQQVAEQTAEAPAVVGFSPLGNNGLHQREITPFTKGEEGNAPMGNINLPNRGISLTENTAENTKKSTADNTHTLRSESEHLLFNEIWQHYPRKVGRSKAQTAYIEAIAKGANPFAILVETALYNQYIQAQLEHEEITQRFIPTGGTWFSEERWNDETPSISSRLGYDEGRAYNERFKKLKRLAAMGEGKEGDEAAAVLASINTLLTELPY